MTIRWTKPAVDDLTHICDHTLERFGPVQARRAAQLIFNSAGSLKDMPNRGRMGRKPETRELPIPPLPFVLIYRSRTETIEILRVLHGAQRWP